MIKNRTFLSALLLLMFFLTGCAEPNSVLMMPAPVIYHDATVDPYSHLSQEGKTTSVPVLYATNRKPQPSSAEIPYGNGMSDVLHLGEVNIRFGDSLTSWEDLYRASTRADHPDPIYIRLEETVEIAAVPTDELQSGELSYSASLQNFANNINNQLANAIDKEIIIYVHGAKGSFLKSVVLTAELDHFSGRDFIGIAFSWPSHQGILSYIVGDDIQRALHSTASLRTLLEFLAKYTRVKHINVICYSAGGKLVSKAIYEMRQNHPLLSPKELKNTFKLDTVLFTAADLSIERFMERLPSISEMTQQVVVTVSDADKVLSSAKIFMGGDDRIGTREAEAREEDFVLKNHIDNFEIIDFSFGQEVRGFDITGHHYWHRHPWASSDIIFLLRTDLPARYRGLKFTGTEGVWYLSEEYPSQVRNAVKRELHGQW
ncbi:MAG: alpha/beta hydrolase [Thermodesulfobacteriota bacterium]|nr:alpha/beta hydrolase [Thermodesulfobacteriota bacterium]